MAFTHWRAKGMLVGWLLAIVLLAASVTGYAQGTDPKDTLFQVSTLTGLEHGVFFPVTTVGELKKHGSVGVGAFEAMDGELILIDGKAYNAMFSGKVVPVDDKTPITYSAVAFMNADRTAALKNVASYAELQQSLDKLLPNLNLFYAFKIHGTFNYLKVRSTAKQEQPYPGLAEVVKNQSVFEYANVTGTLVGVRCPAYIKGVYAPGYHLHFISDDLQKGGHLLEINLAEVTAQIAFLPQMHVLLPDSDGARAVDLTK